MNTVLLALIAGGAIGIALGALGGGGGVLGVPVLIYLLGLEPATAATASLLVVAGTSVTALVRHWANVQWRTGALFAAAGVVPAVGAAALAHHVPPSVLTGIFAMIATAAAFSLLRTTQEVEASAGVGVLTATRVGTGRTLASGGGLGAITGLLGVGGGFLAVPTLVTLMRLRMPAAVATSLFVIAVNSTAALATRLSTAAPTLDWTVLGPFAGAALLGAWDGKRLAAKVSETTLRKVFAVLLLALAAFMLVDSVINHAGR